MRVLYENPSKEEKESSFFDSFVSTAKDLPCGEWARAEAPDYILRTDKKNIWIRDNFTRTESF
jgi:hypothetical protein